jgi:hypothetical protein
MEATQLGRGGGNLFFVLSDFLITEILIDSENSPTTITASDVVELFRSCCILLDLDSSKCVAPATLDYLGLRFIYLSNVLVLLGVAEDCGPLC